MHLRYGFQLRLAAFLGVSLFSLRSNADCYQVFDGPVVCAQCDHGFNIQQCAYGCGGQYCSTGYGECCPNHQQYKTQNVSGTCTDDPFCSQTRRASVHPRARPLPRISTLTDVRESFGQLLAPLLIPSRCSKTYELLSPNGL